MLHKRGMGPGMTRVHVLYQYYRGGMLLVAGASA
jgi:hypothetical protein